MPSSKCADVAPPVKAIGDTCATGDYCKGGATCVSGTCTAYAKSGDACALDGSKAACNPYAGLSCQAGTCAAAVPLTCN